MKKSAFKVIAESIHLDRKGKIKMPTSRVEHRRISVDEIKNIVKEEFEDAKKVEDVEAQEGGFEDAELEKEIEWMKAMNIKEFFIKSKK